MLLIRGGSGGVFRWRFHLAWRQDGVPLKSCFAGRPVASDQGWQAGQLNRLGNEA